MTFKPRLLLEALDHEQARFVVVGGLAMTAHGSSYVTFDLDLCYQRAASNYERIVSALAQFDPRLRVESEPTGVPFLFDTSTIEKGANFTLTTDAGDIDLLAEVSGIGNFAEVMEASVPVEIFGRQIAILDLPGLITSKKAAGRPKDLEHARELEALLAMRGR